MQRSRAILLRIVHAEGCQFFVRSDAAAIRGFMTIEHDFKIGARVNEFIVFTPLQAYSIKRS
jgi:hypothetical protein